METKLVGKNPGLKLGQAFQNNKSIYKFYLKKK